MQRTRMQYLTGHGSSERGWLRRGVTLGVISSLHLLAVLALLAWHPNAPSDMNQETSSALEVRFIDANRATAVVRTPMPVPKTARLVTRAISSTSETRHHDAPARPAAVPVSRTAKSALPGSPPATDRPMHETSSESPVSPPGTPAFVPGGNLLQADGGMAASRAYRLPGGPPGKGAPVLRLKDPRTQGLAGAARVIQGFLGVTDKHCLQLDTWQGMTTEERVANHITDADMARLSNDHGCHASNAIRTGS